jgi:hypothetical protein
MCIFYMANSIIQVLDGTVLDDTGYYVVIALLYGCVASRQHLLRVVCCVLTRHDARCACRSVYISILHNGQKQLTTVSSVTKLFTPAMQGEFTRPLIHKERMYICFLLLVLCSLLSEAAIHATLHEQSHFFPALCVYEVPCTLLL